MSKKTLIIFIATALFSISIIILLYGLSNNPLKYSQNFSRVFRQDVIQQMRVLAIKNDAYYIAGATTDCFYFGNKKDAFDLLITDTMLTETRHVRLNIDSVASSKLRKSYVQIDSPFFFIKDGNMPSIFKGKLNYWHAGHFMDHCPPFAQAVPINPNSLIIQTIVNAEETNLKKNILGKVTVDSPYVQLNSNVLENQVDGLYSTAGILKYSKELNQLVYTYFYLNEYLVMDTSLNILFKGNTIDMVNYPRIKPIKVKENTYTLASPPAIVNRSSQIFGKWLFVHSNIMAKNEQREAFDNACVIDVYNLITKDYKFSFYLFDYSNQKMKGFKVYHNLVIVIYDNYIATYNLNNQILPT